MMEGVIVASPIEGECKMCPFAAVCKTSELATRKVATVKQETIVDALTGDENAKT